MPEVMIGNVVITNHAGEYKKEYKGLRGVLLKSVLEKVTIDSPGPKELSSYYFVLEASDGYKNVFSWNELFNTEIGKQVFLITGYENMQLAEMPERIMVIASKDFRTGRRNLKSLALITVAKVE